MAEATPALDALLTFKLNDMHPFDTTAFDLAATSLEQAHALTAILGTAFSECAEVQSTNGSLVHAAFDGVGRLIALAALAGEVA